MIAVNEIKTEKTTYQLIQKLNRATGLLEELVMTHKDQNDRLFLFIPIKHFLVSTGKNARSLKHYIFLL